MTPHHTIQHPITPYSITLHLVTPLHTMPYHITAHPTLWHHTIEHHVTSQDTASHFTSCNITPSPCSMTPLHPIPYQTALHYTLCTTSHHTSYYTTPHHHKTYCITPRHITPHVITLHHTTLFYINILTCTDSWYYIVLSLISIYHGTYHDSDICVSCLCISESLHEVKKKLIKYWLKTSIFDPIQERCPAE